MTVYATRRRRPAEIAVRALDETTGRGSGSAPVGLLVECPADLIELLRGQKVHISVGGRWTEIGEIDADGKATGDLPEGMDFRPPFAFRVGELGEHPAEVEGPGESR